VPKAGKILERSEFNYRHLVGRLDRTVGRVLSDAPAIGGPKDRPYEHGRSEGPALEP
jgi:hypothetical protein